MSLDTRAITIFDGTNGPAAVKAANTIPTSADPALVVSLNPNAAAPKASTSAITSVAASASNVTVLAANANRLGATVMNDQGASGTADLRLKLGATASSTSFTVLVRPNGYYEVPFGYTGIIDGIWSAANGNARVTEITA